MNNRKTLFFSLTGGIFLLSLSVFGTQFQKKVLAYGENIQDKIEIFSAVVSTIQRNYVDERSIDELLEGAVYGMLATLDPHTNYLPADNFKKWNQNFEGTTGIGILFDVIGSYPMITGFVKNTPAALSRLTVGDLIVKINGHSTRDLDKSGIVDLIRQTVSGPVALTVYDRVSGKSRVLKLRRAQIPASSISEACMLGDDTGYIAIEKFNGTTAMELETALDKLLYQGMKYLLLDLRDNGGGYLSAAVEVTDTFLPAGKLITYTRGRFPHSYQEYRATMTSKYENIPMIVLLNHGTASAAEIVAGALQDWDRALIAGTRSFGKGLVQSQFRFRDGSALLVTTARYFSPLGRMIQRDYTNRSKDQYYAEAYIEEAARSGSKESVFKTLKGRKVYEGGGIFPDIVVSNRDAEISDALLGLYLDEENYFTKFASSILIENPAYKGKAPTEFANFQLTATQIDMFYTFLQKEGYAFSRDEFERNREDIAFLIKRDFAYLASGREGRFNVNALRDAQLIAAYQERESARSLLDGTGLTDLVKTGDK